MPFQKAEKETYTFILSLLKKHFSSITVESVRSRWRRLMGSLLERWWNTEFATPKFPSPFSKSIGFT